MKAFLLTLAIILSYSILPAQVVFEERLEIEKDIFADEEHVNVFGEKGFIITAKVHQHRQQEHRLKYAFFNKDLELEHTLIYPLDKKYFPQRNLLEEYLARSFETDNTLHQVYKNRKGEFAIITVNVDNQEIDKVEGTFPKRSVLKNMLVFGDYAYLHLEHKKLHQLFAINWKTGQQKEIALNWEEGAYGPNKIREFQILEQEQQLFVYLHKIKSKTEKETFFLELNPKAEITNRFNLSEKLNRRVININTTKLDKDHYVFTGTYSTDSEMTDHHSEGLFYAHMVGEDFRFVKYYNFMNLAEFTSYLPEEDQEDIRYAKRIASIKGDDLRIYYSLMTHDLRMTPDGSLFVGEVFFPVKEWRKHTSFGGWGSIGQSTNGFVVNEFSGPFYEYLKGYQYTHAVIVKFDQFGEIMWDQIVKTDREYLPKTVDKFLTTKQQNPNMLNFVIANDDELISNTLDPQNGRFFRETIAEQIASHYPNDEAKRSISRVLHWYDDYYFVYGYQKIKNRKDKRIKRNRNVLFINKIEYRQPKANN